MQVYLPLLVPQQFSSALLHQVTAFLVHFIPGRMDADARDGAGGGCDGDSGVCSCGGGVDETSEAGNAWGCFFNNSGGRSSMFAAATLTAQAGDYDRD